VRSSIKKKEGGPGIVLATRLNSYRLPKKIFLPFGDTSILGETMSRCFESGYSLVLATSIRDRSEIMSHLTDLGSPWSEVYVYSGSEEDVLDRVTAAAQEEMFDPVIRITHDCPLVDPEMIRTIVWFFENAEVDYFSNCHPIRCVPHGHDVEVFSLRTLGTINRLLDAGSEDREHVTRYIYESGEFICGQPIAALVCGADRICPWPNYSIDTREDYVRLLSWHLQTAKRS